MFLSLSAWIVGCLTCLLRPCSPSLTPPPPQPPSGSTYYNVVVEGISVAGKRLRFGSDAFEGGYGAVFDSGTTFAYLPSPVFDAFHKEVSFEAPQNLPPTVFDALHKEVGGGGGIEEVALVFSDRCCGAWFFTPHLVSLCGSESVNVSACACVTRFRACVHEHVCVHRTTSISDHGCCYRCEPHRGGWP